MKKLVSAQPQSSQPAPTLAQICSVFAILTGGMLAFALLRMQFNWSVDSAAAYSVVAGLSFGLAAYLAVHWLTRRR